MDHRGEPDGDGHEVDEGPVDDAQHVGGVPVGPDAVGLDPDLPGQPETQPYIAEDGTLYIGTDAEAGLVVVSPGKTVAAPFAAYRSFFGGGLRSLAWGSANDLYASTAQGALLRFSVRGKTSAPYYGSTL